MSEGSFATALAVTIDDNTAMRAFFKKFSRDEAAIKANLYHELPQIISQRPHKIKAAWGLKHQGQTILEYKIVLKPRSFRAAYIQRVPLWSKVKASYLTVLVRVSDDVRWCVGSEPGSAP